MPVRPKAGSKPYRDQLRAELARLGAHGQRLVELIARDLQQRGIRPRQAWRYAAELSQREAAERFNQTSGNPRAPMTGNRISDYEQWPHNGVRPSLPALRTLADAYGTSWDQLIDAHDLRHMPEGDRIEYLERPGPVLRPARTAVARTSVPLRQGPGGRLSRDDLIGWIADESQEFGEWVGMSEVADATIGQYQTHVRRLSREFEHAAPPLPALLETRKVRDRVIARLRGHQRIDQTKELYLLAAQVCGLLAWMTGDLGSYRAADTHAWTAWMCAEQAGHDGARAWVRVTQAKLAYWDGRYVESAQLAEDGLSYQTTDTARLFLTLFHARSLARVGRHGESRQALAQAETERDRISAADQVGGIWGLTPTRYHGLRASTHLLLGEPTEALAETARVIALSEAEPTADRHLYAEMLARIDAAMSHLQQPDLDGAIAALRPVLDLPAENRIACVTQHLARCGNALTLPRFAAAPQAWSLQEEIEAYSREAIFRQLIG